MPDKIQNTIEQGKQLFPFFEDALKSKSPAKLTTDWVKREEMQIESTTFIPLSGRKPRKVDVFYLPFEHINLNARIVLVGMTPGHKQMLMAAKVLNAQLSNFGCVDLREIKTQSSFAGSLMRSNLTRMLDYYNIPSLIGVKCGEALFKSHWQCLHTTSLLRYPVFVDGKDFNGQIDMLENTFLRKYVINYFCREIANLDNPYIIPLGDEVAEVIKKLVNEQQISENRVIDRLRHPSPESGTRVKYVIEEVTRSNLKVGDPVWHCVDKYDEERSRVKTKVEKLRAEI